MKRRRARIIQQRIENNMDVLDDGGPRLSYNYRHWIAGRDPKNKMVLIGGLGCMGVGSMWRPEDEQDKKDPTYKDAPEMSWEESKLAGAKNDKIMAWLAEMLK